MCCAFASSIRVLLCAGPSGTRQACMHTVLAFALTHSDAPGRQTECLLHLSVLAWWEDRGGEMAGSATCSILWHFYACVLTHRRIDVCCSLRPSSGGAGQKCLCEGCWAAAAGGGRWCGYVCRDGRGRHVVPPHARCAHLQGGRASAAAVRPAVRLPLRVQSARSWRPCCHGQDLGSVRA